MAALPNNGTQRFKIRSICKRSTIFFKFSTRVYDVTALNNQGLMVGGLPLSRLFPFPLGLFRNQCQYVTIFFTLVMNFIHKLLDEIDAESSNTALVYAGMDVWILR